MFVTISPCFVQVESSPEEEPDEDEELKEIIAPEDELLDVGKIIPLELEEELEEELLEVVGAPPEEELEELEEGVSKLAVIVQLSFTVTVTGLLKILLITQFELSKDHDEKLNIPFGCA